MPCQAWMQSSSRWTTRMAEAPPTTSCNTGVSGLPTIRGVAFDSSNILVTRLHRPSIRLSYDVPSKDPFVVGFTEDENVLCRRPQLSDSTAPVALPVHVGLFPAWHGQTGDDERGDRTVRSGLALDFPEAHSGIGVADLDDPVTGTPVTRTPVTRNPHVIARQLLGAHRPSIRAISVPGPSRGL